MFGKVVAMMLGVVLAVPPMAQAEEPHEQKARIYAEIREVHQEANRLRSKGKQEAFFGYVIGTVAATTIVCGFALGGPPGAALTSLAVAPTIYLAVTMLQEGKRKQRAADAHFSMNTPRGIYLRQLDDEIDRQFALRGANPSRFDETRVITSHPTQSPVAPGGPVGAGMLR